MPPMLASPPGIYLTTFLFSLVGGVVPFLNVEAYLLSLSALSPQTAVAPVALAAAMGQMAAKSLLYLTGRGLLRLPLGGKRDRIGEAAARLSNAECGAMSLVLVSAITGIPPFYAVSVAAGFLRLRFGRFLALGCCGRLLRFAAVLILPRVF